MFVPLKYKYTQMKSDYLKFYRVINKYIKLKYDLSQPDLDMIMFLYSEGYFGTGEFNEFASVINWDRRRFLRLIEDGWIEKFRERKGRRRALYTLTFKAKRMVDSYYRKLNGGPINDKDTTHPLFRVKEATYSTKVYRNMIRKMNHIRKKRPGVIDDIPE